MTERHDRVIRLQKALDATPDRKDAPDDLGYGMEFRVELITPDVAEMILEGNAENRNLRRRLVSQYARVMRFGDWRLTHEAIAIAADGKLVDGQHRLNAVIEADTPVWMTVAYYVPMSARAVIDSGAKRTDADAAHWYGIGDGRVTHHHTSVARLLMVSYGSASSRYIARMDVLSFLKRHMKAIRFALEVSTGHKRGVCIAPVRAAVTAAFYHENHGQLARFSEVLGTGLATSEGEHAAVVLREHLSGVKATRNPMGRDETLRKAEQAISYFCDGFSPKTLRAPKGLIYDLPVASSGSEAPALAAVG